MAFFNFTYSWVNRRGDTVKIEYIPTGAVGPLLEIPLPRGSVNVGGLTKISSSFEAGVPVGFPTAAKVDIPFRVDFLTTAASRGYSVEIADLLQSITSTGGGVAGLDVGSGETVAAGLSAFVRISSTGPSWGGSTRVLFEGVQDPLDEVPISPIEGSGATITITARHIYRALGTLIPVEALARKCFNELTPPTPFISGQSEVEAYWTQAGENIVLYRRKYRNIRTFGQWLKFRDIIDVIEALYNEHYQNLTRDSAAVFLFDSESGLPPTPLDYVRLYRWSGDNGGNRAGYLTIGASSAELTLWVLSITNDVVPGISTVEGTGGLLEDTGSPGSLYKADSIFDILNRLAAQGAATGTVFHGDSPTPGLPAAGCAVYFGKCLDRASPDSRPQTWTIEEKDLGPSKGEPILRKSIILNVEAGYPEGKDGPINAERTGSEKRTESDTGTNIDFILHNLPNLNVHETDAVKWPKVGNDVWAFNARTLRVDDFPFDANVYYMSWNSDGVNPAGVLAGTVTEPIPVLCHPAVSFDLGPYVVDPAVTSVPLEDESGNPVKSTAGAVGALRRGLRRNSWGINLAEAIVTAFGRPSQWGIEGRQVPYELANLETMGGYFEFQRNGVTKGIQLWTGEHAAFSSLPTACFLVDVSIDVDAGTTECAFLAVERSAP